MMKLQVSNWVMIVLCITLSKGVTAQRFRYQSMLDKVPQTGFYSIPVTPQLSAHTQVDFSDVRIWDDTKKQVPYIIRNRKPRWQVSLFHPFPIMESKLDDSGRSVIVIQKNVDYSVATLSLIIHNASVSRNAALSGSNDGKNWFIISENISVNNSYETGADSSIQSIEFPSSAYPYFRLVIDNQKSDPLNISSIGYYPNLEYKSVNPYTANPQPQMTQTDSSDGFSYIKVVQPAAYPVAQLSFKIDGPKYFARPFAVLLSATDRKGRTYFNETASFSVASTVEFKTAIPVFKSKVFYIRIRNGDNPPLQIASVATAQEYHELVAWLEKEKEYRLVMDADDATVPHYDLQQFSDSIPVQIAVLNSKEITPVTNNTTASSSSFPRKYIWLMMIAVVALLSLLTWRLTTEMKKSS
jgi:hypothetical protein